MCLTIALSTLGENPRRQTGLTTLFRECVAASLALYNDVSWIVFVSDDSAWSIRDSRVTVVKRSHHTIAGRLFQEHWWAPIKARDLGADVYLTVGTVPLIKALPTAVQVITLHHLDANNKVERMRALYRKYILERGLRAADLIIANSHWTASRLTTINAQAACRMIVSYEGVDHNIFNPRQDPAEQDNLWRGHNLLPGYILWVSNLYAYKQPELLIRGYALLEPSIRARYPLVIVGGSWTAGRELVRSEAERLGILGDIRMLGWIAEQDLPMLYRNATVLCLASREETFGRSVIESMACGTACLLNDIPVMHEVTNDHAVIVDFRDSGQVANAITAILTDETLRTSLVREGLLRSKSFSFQRLAEERVTAMRTVLAQIRKRKTLPNGHESGYC